MTVPRSPRFALRTALRWTHLWHIFLLTRLSVCWPASTALANWSSSLFDAREIDTTCLLLALTVFACDNFETPAFRSWRLARIAAAHSGHSKIRMPTFVVALCFACRFWHLHDRYSIKEKSINESINEFDWNREWNSIESNEFWKNQTNSIESNEFKKNPTNSIKSNELNVEFGIEIMRISS